MLESDLLELAAISQRIVCEGSFAGAYLATRSPFDTVITLSIVCTGSHSSELGCELYVLLDRGQKAQCHLPCFIRSMPNGILSTGLSGV